LTNETNLHTTHVVYKMNQEIIFRYGFLNSHFKNNSLNPLPKNGA